MGCAMTTNRNDPLLKKIRPDGQQEAYLVLSEDERSKGFVAPVRRSYKHLACGCTTTMGNSIAETYARNPKFYSGTFCCYCGAHFALGPPWSPNFLWTDDLSPVGALPVEAKMYFDEQEAREKVKELGSSI